MGMDVIFQWAQMTRVGLYAMSKGRLKGPHFFWYVNMRVYVTSSGSKQHPTFHVYAARRKLQ